MKHGSLHLTKLLLHQQVLINPTGEKPDPDQTFKLTSVQNFISCLPNSCTTVVSNHSIPHRQPETVLMETPQDTLVSWRGFGVFFFFKLCLVVLPPLWSECFLERNVVLPLKNWFSISGIKQTQPGVLQL